MIIVLRTIISARLFCLSSSSFNVLIQFVFVLFPFTFVSFDFAWCCFLPLLPFVCSCLISTSYGVVWYGYCDTFIDPNGIQPIKVTVSFYFISFVICIRFFCTTFDVICSFQKKMSIVYYLSVCLAFCMQVSLSTKFPSKIAKYKNQQLNDSEKNAKQTQTKHKVETEHILIVRRRKRARAKNNELFHQLWNGQFYAISSSFNFMIRTESVRPFDFIKNERTNEWMVRGLRSKTNTNIV